MYKVFFVITLFALGLDLLFAVPYSQLVAGIAAIITGIALLAKK